MIPAALSIDGVSKSYDGYPALRSVDLQVEPGQILVLLGPNGAGKTTLISIVAGLRQADAGTVRIMGADVRTECTRARSSIGFASQDTAVYPTVSVRDNMRLFGRIGGLWGSPLESRIDHLAGVLALEPLLERKARFLSGGEKRRLHTALALIHDPPLLLLDEPTTGADPLTRANMLEYVAKLAGEGTAVVYTTHYLTEIEALGSFVTIAILHQGRVIANGPIECLVREHSQPRVALTFASPVTDEMIARIRRSRSLKADVTQPSERVLHLASDQPIADALAVLSRLRAPDLVSLNVYSGNLENVFLSLTDGRYQDG